MTESERRGQHTGASFDFWADVNPGRSVWEANGSRDPDSLSKRLQSAHKKLWTKRLPNGSMFSLEPVQRTQLQFGKFRMSSDSIGSSYMTNSRMREIVLQAGDHAEELFRCGCQIGGFILLPAYQVNKKFTINAARGISRKIDDRMDLTLEAIRRHYLGQTSPLSDDLSRYQDFFELFMDFQGYVDFWLLNDLVGDNYQVQFFLPFDNYSRNGAPADVNEYLALKGRAISFLRARTLRLERELAPEAGGL